MLDIINIDFIKNYNEMPSNNGSNHSREISGRSNFHEMFKNSIRESENKNKNEYSHEIKSNNKAKKIVRPKRQTKIIEKMKHRKLKKTIRINLI